MTIPLEIKRAYTLKGVPVSVKAVANVKIRGDDTSLQAAAERFLGMTHDQIQKVVFQTLEGHLRSILGTLTVEEVNSDRQSFAQKLTSEAATDLEKMGLGVDVLTIQEISRRGGVPQRARQAPHGGSQARRDDRRSRGAPRRQDQVVAGAAGRGAGEVQGRRRDLAGVARLHDPPGAVPGGDRDAEGARRAGRPAVGSHRAAGGRRRGGPGRADAHAGADRGPGAGSPAPAEGARGDGDQARRGRSSGGGRARRGRRSSPRSSKPKAGGRRSSRSPKPSRRSCGRKASAARRRSRRKAGPRPPRSKRSVWRRPRRSRRRASPKRPRSCGRPKRGSSSTTRPASRPFSRSCRPSSRRRAASSARSRRRSATSTSWSSSIRATDRPTAAAARSAALAKTSPAVVFSLLQQLEALGLNVPSVLQQLGLSSTSAPPARRRAAPSRSHSSRPAAAKVNAVETSSALARHRPVRHVHPGSAINY